MKRFLCLIIAVIMVISLGACGGANSDESTDTDNATTLQTEPSQAVTTAPQKVQNTEETMYDRIVREIDGEYKEKQELPENYTTAGMVQLAVEYREKWEDVAQTCYEKLMEYEPIELPDSNLCSAEEFHTYIDDYMKNWEQYRDADFEMYGKIILRTSGGGSAVAPRCAQYEYRRTMEWALGLVGICQQLRIEL